MIMCEVESLANTYLNNLNSTARKFSRDIDNFRSSFGTKWSEFPEEKKDELVDKFVVGSEVRNKYKDFPRPDNVEECFPVLKIKSGEKIVVDFDNEDGWTWQDEHSGPFSWKTKSQENLSLFDDAPPTGQKSETSKPGKPPRKSHSPDRDTLNTNLAFKPEKSIWDSPFLVGEKALVQSDSDIFEQLGINFNAARENSQEQHSKHEPPLSPQGSVRAEDARLLASPEHTNKAFTLNEPDQPAATSSDGSRQSSVSPPESPAIRKLSGKNKAGRWWPGRRSKAEAEQSLMSELSVTVGEMSSGGQLSPVYIEEPGESTTDDLELKPPADRSSQKNINRNSSERSQYSRGSSERSRDSRGSSERSRDSRGSSERSRDSQGSSERSRDSRGSSERSRVEQTKGLKQSETSGKRPERMLTSPPPKPNSQPERMLTSPPPKPSTPPITVTMKTTTPLAAVTMKTTTPPAAVTTKTTTPLAAVTAKTTMPLAAVTTKTSTPLATQPQMAPVTTQPQRAPLSTMDDDDDEDETDWLGDSSSGLTGLPKTSTSSSSLNKTGFDFLDDW